MAGTPARGLVPLVLMLLVAAAWPSPTQAEPLDEDIGVVCTPYLASEAPSECVGLHRAIKVGAGSWNTCVILENRNVFCWGVDPPAPYHGGDAVDLSVGAGHVCIKTADDDVHCWGSDTRGQLMQVSTGDAVTVSTGDHHTCVLFTNGNVVCEGYDIFDSAVDYLQGDAVALDSGRFDNCVVRTTGDIHCWGANPWSWSDPSRSASSVRVGGNAVCFHIESAFLVQCRGLARQFTRAVEAYDVAGPSGKHARACILYTAGTARCWGDDTYGQDADHTSPTGIDLAVAATHNCVLLRSGNVDCYGDGLGGKAADYRHRRALT